MQALEVIRQSAGDITFSKNSLIEDIKGDVRVACNREWVEWIEKNCTSDIYGGMTFLAKDWQSRRKEVGI
jgi:hypothetical protein